MKKKESPQKSKSSLEENSPKTVGACKALAKDIADWVAKQNKSPILRYYEHVSYAFDKAIELAGMVIHSANLSYLTTSTASKQFFMVWGHLYENLFRARELRGPEPEIKKGKFPKNSNYDVFLGTWPRTPGITFGLELVDNSALEMAYHIATCIEGAILSAQETAMGRGQGSQFDSLLIDDPRISNWLPGIFTNEIRRLLGLPDSIQKLMGYTDRWSIQELYRDASSLRSKLSYEKKIFLENNPDNDEYVTLLEFMKRYCEDHPDYKARRDAIYKAESAGKIKLPESISSRTARKAPKFTAKSLRLAWGGISKEVNIPPLKT